MDSIDVKRFIIDCKTSRAKWPPIKINSEYQPSVYTLGYQAEYKMPPAGFCYHFLICTRKNRIYAYPVVTQRSQQQILSVLERFKAMHEAIRKGVFTPTHQSYWKCSADWCKFYRECKFVKC